MVLDYLSDDDSGLTHQLRALRLANALILMLETGNGNIMEMLIDAGDEWVAASSMYRLAIIGALAHDRLHIVRLLLQRLLALGATEQQARFVFLLRAAVRSGNISCVELMLD